MSNKNGKFKPLNLSLWRKEKCMSERKSFENMYEYPLQDVSKFCDKCKYLKKAITEKEAKKLSSQTLGDFRKACTTCRGGAWSNKYRGIYKADAILGAYMGAYKLCKKILPPGKGRKSIIPANTIKSILKQYDEGLSAREIARRTGYSHPTILKVIQQRNQQRNGSGNEVKGTVEYRNR